MTKELKQEFIDEVVEKVFNQSESMRKYFNSSVSAVVKTQDGFLIGFDKPTIEKRFCFSYDEHVPGSYEDASKTARDVNKNYFMQENLKSLERALKNLETENIYLIINYRQFGKITTWVTEDYKQRFETTKYFEISEADKQQLIETQKQEIEKFKKRLETYFKKYGVSKLRTWTYSVWD